MDKTIKRIIELNKIFYLDKEFNNAIYVQELISIIQSHTLDYNLYLQTQNMNFLSQYIKTYSEHHISNNTHDSHFHQHVSKLVTAPDTEEDNELNKHPMTNKSLKDVCFENDTYDDLNTNTVNTENNIHKDTYEKDPTLDYIDQCCARVDNKVYNLDDYEPEFIDSFPSSVYISRDACIIGSPCCNIVNDFDEVNNIFCNEHKNGYEDIREPPFMNM
jgi:hypothetical protein